MKGTKFVALSLGIMGLNYHFGQIQLNSSGLNDILLFVIFYCISIYTANDFFSEKK